MWRSSSVVGAGVLGAFCPPFTRTFFRCLLTFTPSCLVQLLCRTIPVQDALDVGLRPIYRLLLFLDSQYAARTRISLFSR